MSKNQRLNASITIGAVLEGSVKKNIGVLKSGLTSIGTAIKGVESRQKELAKQRKVLEREGKSVDALDREYKDLERTLDRLRRAQERWAAAARASARVGTTFRAMTSDIGRQARRMAIGVTAAGTAIFGLANSTATLGDNVAKTADKLGIGIEQLQELRYAAERSGVSTSEFDKALEKMQKNLGEAASGSGTAKDALEQLGLSAEQLITMSPDEALGIIADRMTGVETAAEKAALANDIFGRSGIGMINMLRDGSTGLDKLREDARRTGYVLSEQAARDAEVFGDTLLDMKLTAQGVKNTFGAELMPVVTRAMRSISDWMGSNREQVKRWAAGFASGVERVLPVIGEMTAGLTRVGVVVGRMVARTAELVGGWENLGIAIGVALASGTIVKIGRFALAVVGLGRALFGLVGTLPLVAGGIKSIGVALMLNPIGFAIAAIAGGAYLIWKNWEPIKAWFSGLWTDVENSFGGFSSFVGSMWAGDMDGAIDDVERGWDGLKNLFVKNIDLMTTPLQRGWEGTIKPIMDELGLTEPIGKAWDTVKATLGAAVDWIGEKFTSAWGFIEPVIDGLLSGETIGKAWESVKVLLQPVLDWIGEKFEWLGGVTGPVIDGLKWVGGKAQGALGKIGIGGGADQGSGASGGWGVQGNWTGGPYRPGWVLTGERGPELKYENRAGWVADNRATRTLAGYADKVSAMMRQGSAALAPATAGAVTHVHQYTVHAAGASAEEIVAILDRRARQAAGAGLFDRVPGTGPWGR